MKKNKTILIVIVVILGLPLLSSMIGNVAKFETELVTKIMDKIDYKKTISVNEEILSQCEKWYSKDSSYIEYTGLTFVECDRSRSFILEGGVFKDLKPEFNGFKAEQEEIRNKNEKYRRILNNDGLVIFEPQWELRDRNGQRVVFIYYDKSVRQLRKRFAPYSIYSDIDFPKKKNWLYKIDEHVYICAP